jgi:hypothetical protein
MFAKIENENRFVKNLRNGALINTDIAELKEYKNKRESMNKINTITEEINTMKSEMSEIKSLLQQLVNKTFSEK